MTVIVAVVAAGRERGKTTLLERLTRAFSENIRVWTVKHVSKTFDTEEKDTWRHLEAGAEGTVAVGPDQLIVLRPSAQATLETAIGEISRDIDLVLVEGFRQSGYPKVLAALSVEEAEQQLQEIRDVFAISGPVADARAGGSVQGVPILSVDELVKRLSWLVVEDQVKRLPGIDCKKCGYPSCAALASAILRGEVTLKSCRTLQVSDVVLAVDDARVYLSEFPKNFVKNVIVAMVGSLKGVDVGKAKRIIIEVDT